MKCQFNMIGGNNYQEGTKGEETLLKGPAPVTQLHGQITAADMYVACPL